MWISKARIEREDLVMFINACFACTGQREFYQDKPHQNLSISFLHAYILGNYRRLYARTLAAGINHFNQAQIVLHLLEAGSPAHKEDRELEGALIRHALRSMPPQRALRLFYTLRQKRINNRRTRAVVREWIAHRPNPAFDAVKYRSLLRSAAVHAHLELPGEIGQFVFEGPQSQSRWDTPLLDSFRRALHDKEAVFDLPYTVAEGLAAQHRIPRAYFLERIADNMTAGEKFRLQRAASRTGTSLDVDLHRMPLTRLALYFLSLSQELRAVNRPVMEDAMRASATRAASRAGLRLGRVAAVLDRSYSTAGSRQKRQRPLAISLGVHALLRATADTYKAFWTEPVDWDLGVFPRGQTNLAGPLIDALEWGADLVVIVSDGFENDPPGATDEVARVFRAQLDPAGETSIVHINPVFDTEHFAPRTLGSNIPTVGLRDAEDLLMMLNFARFAEGNASLDELEAYLQQRCEHVLRKYQTARAA